MTPTPERTEKEDGGAHTPAPWTITHGMNYNHLRNNYTGRYVARVPDDGRGCIDAAHIVHCVNSHADLVAQNEALRGALERAQVVMDDAAGYLSKRNLGEPARLLWGRLYTEQAKARSLLTTTTPAKA